ncbi:MAG: ribulose-phosphate 3-epimerase [Candidatus Omnitrophica bacterium]|nr:ribulose-phosphate 3-epimerase [Candidatus Omnitrophota bacterium]
MTSAKRKIFVAPSILSADFGRLAEEIQEVEKGGCDVIHVDVMDGHFVPNLTIGPPVIRAIRRVTKLPLDVHLMIEQPGRYLDEYRKAGSDWITIHVEASSDVDADLKKIRDLGAKAGLSLRPKTSVSTLKAYLSKIDLVLIMTVEPGFGGQAFMPDMVQKIKDLRGEFPGLISVDGGIAADTVKTVIEAGVDVLVAGTGIFGERDRSAAIRKLRMG